MLDVTERLRRVEDRLERLLASGWRNARGEAAELEAEAEALETIGLAELATRLRAVGAASGPREALGAITLAASACRLLHARLDSDSPPPGAWQPLVTPAPVRKRAPAAADRLVPLARLTLDGDEVWACVATGGRARNALVLLDPLPVEQAAEPLPAPGGLLGWLRRAGQPPQPAPSFWLYQPARGRLRWRGRSPLGAAGDLERCALDDAAWLTPPDSKEDPLDTFRAALTAAAIRDSQPILSTWGPLRVKELQHAEADGYVWLDPAAKAAFHTRAAGAPAWGLAWVEGAIVAPLALLEPGGSGLPGLSRRAARLVHLLPGTPSDPLAGGEE